LARRELRASGIEVHFYQTNVFEDFNVLQTNFSIAPGATWDQGDFNYDGKVLLGDFNALQTNFGVVPPSIAVPSAAAAVKSAANVPNSTQTG